MRGIQGGSVGGAARNIIPRAAVADLDVRLVKGMVPDRTLNRIVAHIVSRGWTVLDHEPPREELVANERLVRITKRAGFPATRTPLDSAVAARVVRAVRAAVDGPVIVMATEGGSLPLYLFERLGIPFVGLPTSNFDCNQHAADENLHLNQFFQGIDIYAAVVLSEEATGTAENI